MAKRWRETPSRRSGVERSGADSGVRPGRASGFAPDPGLQSGPNARRTTESTLTEQARREGRHESDEAYLADASGAASPTGRTRWNQKVLIRVDAAAAERGEALAGERCEIAGIGPISGAEVHALLASDAMKAVVVTDPETTPPQRSLTSAWARSCRSPSQHHGQGSRHVWCRRRLARAPRPPTHRRGGDRHRMDLRRAVPDPGQHWRHRTPRDRPRTPLGTDPTHRARPSSPSPPATNTTSRPTKASPSAPSAPTANETSSHPRHPGTRPPPDTS